MGIGATIGTWDKETDRATHVREKMHSRGTVAASVIQQEHLTEAFKHTRRGVAAKRVSPAVAQGGERKQTTGVPHNKGDKRLSTGIKSRNNGRAEN